MSCSIKVYPPVLLSSAFRIASQYDVFTSERSWEGVNSAGRRFQKYSKLTLDIALSKLHNGTEIHNPHSSQYDDYFIIECDSSNRFLTKAILKQSFCVLGTPQAIGSGPKENYPDSDYSCIKS
ncbi:hypothetical protein EVAR_29189_1 [Eumeta japonica]|uniref:Uncharacterized protein n=1 Tax=Eumeta variegata TaxID=151549 RepID=A0A4C1VAD3_EUMVA|nr:hypothetical protein EVAR_29189_1 [Eumeta japonica]